MHAASHVLLSQFVPVPYESSQISTSKRGFVELDQQFPKHVERSVLNPKHSFVEVHPTARTRFAKQKFA